MYLTKLLVNFTIFCVFLGILRGFTDLLEFRGSDLAKYQNPC